MTTDNDDLNNMYAMLSADARQREVEAIAELQSIAKLVGAERLFTTILIMLSLVPEGSASEATHGTTSVKTELLAYYLFPLFGVPSEGIPTPQLVERTFAILDGLLRDYMLGNRLRDEGHTVQSPALEELINHLIIDVAVVRGSAYPEQTMKEVREIQGHFEAWFVKHAEISPMRAVDSLVEILRAEGKQGNEWRLELRERSLKMESAWREARKLKKSLLTVDQQDLLSCAVSSVQARILGYIKALAELSPNSVPVSREKLSVSPQLTIDEWEALIGLIGCTVDNRKQMHHPVEMQRRPLYVLSQNCVLLSDISNAVDQLWDAFESFARKDQSFYDSTYSRFRARWLENRIALLLEKVFPAQAIYRNLTYPDLDRGKEATTEIDLAIHWPPFVVLIEAKSGQF